MKRKTPNLRPVDPIEVHLEIVLPYAPKPKQSVRGGKGKFFTGSKQREYVNLLKMELRELWSDSNPFVRWVIADIDFCFKVPKRMTPANAVELEDGSILKLTTPDCDNLCKPLFDAMTAAGVVEDDKIIAAPNHRKLWYSDNRIKITLKGE